VTVKSAGPGVRACATFACCAAANASLFWWSRVPVRDEFVIETALKILARRVAKGSLLSSPNAVKSYLRLRLADLQYEVIGLLYLDKRHRLIACDEMYRGTIDGVSTSAVNTDQGYPADQQILLERG
jgi:RadC-like JAB domain